MIHNSRYFQIAVSDQPADKDVSATAPMRWPNLATWLARSGHITIGRVAHVEGAAIAADEHAVLATLVRRPAESLEELLERLDRAIGLALYEGVHTNEVPGGQFMLATTGRPKGKKPS
jgi:hypothetical protein